MAFFDYDKNAKNVEYYEILENLMERWEYETVEFKEAKSSYDTDKIGRYFSCLSNEANLKQQQYGWLVFGVSEKDKIKHLVGTAYKKGDSSILEKFKITLVKALEHSGVLSIAAEENEIERVIRFIDDHPGIGDEDITLFTIRKSLNLPQPSYTSARKRKVV